MTLLPIAATCWTEPLKRGVTPVMNPAVNAEKARYLMKMASAARKQGNLSVANSCLLKSHALLPDSRALSSEMLKMSLSKTSKLVDIAEKPPMLVAMLSTFNQGLEGDNTSSKFLSLGATIAEHLVQLIEKDEPDLNQALATALAENNELCQTLQLLKFDSSSLLKDMRAYCEKLYMEAIASAPTPQVYIRAYLETLTSLVQVKGDMNMMYAQYCNNRLAISDDSETVHPHSWCFS